MKDKIQIAKISNYVVNKNMKLKDAVVKCCPNICDATAITYTSELKTNPLFIESITKKLERVGLSQDQLSSKLSELTNHKKALVVDKAVEYVADGATRIDAVKFAFKLHGLGGDAKTNVEELNVYPLNPEVIGKLDAIAKRLDDTARLMNSEEKTYDCEIIDAQVTVDNSSNNIADTSNSK